ncbi:Angiopoietin-4 [Bienertia sinuspersici]
MDGNVGKALEVIGDAASDEGFEGFVMFQAMHKLKALKSRLRAMDSRLQGAIQAKMNAAKKILLEKQAELHSDSLNRGLATEEKEA